MERTMAKKPAGTPSVMRAPTDVEMVANTVRAERKARRAAKAAEAKAVVKKPGMGRQVEGRKSAFGIAAMASQATAVSRSIISRARGGRGR